VSALSEKLDSFVKNSGYFVKFLKYANLKSLDTLVRFDVSLFTTQVKETLKIVRNKVNNDETLAERSVLQVKAFLELLEVWLRTTYLQVHDEFFLQKDGMSMESSLSPIVSNVYMENFEKLAPHSAQHRQSLCIRYVDDIFSLAS
jgi:hypothetical protein